MDHIKYLWSFMGSVTVVTPARKLLRNGRTLNLGRSAGVETCWKTSTPNIEFPLLCGNLTTETSDAVEMPHSFVTTQERERVLSEWLFEGETNIFVEKSSENQQETLVAPMYSYPIHG